MNYIIIKIERWVKRIYNYFYPANRYSKRCFSQNGEDIVVNSLFKEDYVGFYVDVGCHHPFRFSNTYMFYLRGWNGINIDATPGVREKFEKKRDKDINLQIGISDFKGDLNFFIFDFEHTAVNTFSKEQADLFIVKGEKLKEVRKIPVTTLKDILSNYVPHNKEIDLLTIDVEGFDMQVLQSNDWINYKPKVILVEDQGVTILNYKDSEITNFLNQKGYEIYAVLQNTLIFKLL